jgi:hypothetical protein
MGDWCAEQCHYPIAQKLSDGTIVAMDGVHHPGETALHQGVDLFFTQALGNGSKSGSIGEEHRDGPAFALDT